MVVGHHHIKMCVGKYVSSTNLITQVVVCGMLNGRGSKTVTSVVVIWFGSCLDVVEAYDVMCAADASDMLRHRDFTSMHAHLLSRWLHLPTGLGSNKTNVSVAKYSRDISRVDSRQGMKRCKHACAIYSITGTSLLHPNTHKWCNHHHLQRCTNLLAQNLQFSIW